MMNFVLLECHCVFNSAEDKYKKRPTMCNMDKGPGIHCLADKCPYFSYKSTDEGLVYIGENSVSEKEMLFGGEEDLLLWSDICKNKMKEAYDDYQMSNLSDMSDFHCGDCDCHEVICRVKIDSFHSITIRKNPECNFYDDEVIVELETPEKNYIVAVDSFSYEVYDCITKSIDECVSSDLGEVHWMSGAPYNAGGLELQLTKMLQNKFEMKVVKSKISEDPTVPYIIKFGLVVREEILYDLKLVMQKIKERHREIFAD